MPARDTNHIKTIRYYKYDTVTLERTLHYTENYDRHGYQTNPLTKLTYIRCQPDGRRVEERQVWHVYEQEGESTEIHEYDSQGPLLRSRIIGSKVPYFDREIDYWE